MHKVTFILLVIGGLNWGIYAATGGSWEVGRILGGMDSVWSMIVYGLVGISAVLELLTHRKNCKQCIGGASSSSPISAPMGN